MGIQINGSNDTISAADGGLSISGQSIDNANLNLSQNLSVSGIGTVTNLRATNVSITGVSTVGVLTGATSIQATRLYGDGSALTGVAATSNISTNAIVNSGVTTVSAGSASAPSITPTGDTNTGIFFPTLDYVSVATNGTEQIRVDSSGNVNIDSGTVYVDAVNNRFGVGTTSPNYKLDVKDTIRISGTTTAQLFIDAASGSSGTIYWREANVADRGILGFANGSGDLVYRSAAYDFSSGTERFRCDSSGRLLLGTSSAYVGYGGSSDNKFQIAGTAYSNAAMSAFVFANTPYGGYLNLGLSRNSTVGSHTVVQNGDGLGGITFNGSDGTTFKTCADIQAYVDAAPGTNDMPGRLVFSTTVDGSSSPGEAMRITSTSNSQGSSYDRSIWMSNGSTPDENPTAWKLYVKGSTRLYGDADYTPSSTRKGQHELYSWSGSSGSNSNTWADQKSGLYVRGWLEGGNPGEAASVLLLNGDWSGATNPGRLIKGYQKATTLVFYVAHSGDVRNANNSYGAISDEKLKQDIIDAESQWNDIKNLRVRKFKLKKDVEELGDEAPSLLGLIAQETELVSPGLVDTPGSYGEEGTEDQSLSKTVKYSILYMKAVKALQEAQERIETLETLVSTLTDRVNALESN